MGMITRTLPEGDLCRWLRRGARLAPGGGVCSKPVRQLSGQSASFLPIRRATTQANPSGLCQTDKEYHHGCRKDKEMAPVRRSVDPDRKQGTIRRRRSRIRPPCVAFQSGWKASGMTNQPVSGGETATISWTFLRSTASGATFLMRCMRRGTIVQFTKPSSPPSDGRCATASNPLAATPRLLLATSPSACSSITTKFLA